MIDLDRLQVLVALASHGTASRAAEALHYSQPTISHHLKRLEAETGAVLVRRVGRRLELTEEGRRLAERGEEILGLMSRAQGELDAAVSLQTGRVRLAIFPSGMATLAPRIVTDLARRHPGLALEITEAEPPEAERLLVAGAIDLAVTFTYPEQLSSEAMTTEIIGYDPLFLVSSSTADAAAGTLASLADADWLAGCERCRGYLVGACEREGFTPRIRFASDDYVAIQALVAVGHGVTLLPALALAAHRHPHVSVVAVDGAARDIRLVSLGRPPLPPAFDATAVVIRGVVAAVTSDTALAPSLA